MLTLGIESSCDETSVALVRDGVEILATIVASQEDLHSPHGGVVPELAARAHLERLPRLIDSTLAAAGVGPADVDRIAVTRGPGLAGCLLVGVGVARGLAAAWARPVVGVNHLWGHVHAALLAEPSVAPPLLAMVVSGAHTDLVEMLGYGDFKVLGRTRDDAAGEAFDKAARMLNLGYPGGPLLDRLAERGDPGRFPLPVPILPDLQFSFSGLKTALLYRIRDLRAARADERREVAAGEMEPADYLTGELTDQDRADLAASFRHSVVEALVAQLDRALDRHPAKEVVLCGGVAANSLLRRRAGEVVGMRARLTVPPLALCTDNAAMIAAAGHYSPPGKGTESIPTSEVAEVLAIDPDLPW